MVAERITPWVAANGYMRDDYREAVATIAIQHLPKASAELRRWANKAFEKIELSGYRANTRAMEKASLNTARSHVIQKMQASTKIAAAVICLWAEAEAPLLSEFRKTAENSGFAFKPDWSWETAQLGFHDFEEVQPLNEFGDELSSQKTGLDIDHIKLAVLWFSRALVSADGWIARAATPLLEEKTPSIEKPAESESESSVVDFTTLDLVNLSAALQSGWQAVESSYSVMLANTKSLQAAIEASMPEQPEERIMSVQKSLGDWRAQQRRLKTALRQSAQRLARDLALRPDMAKESGDSQAFLSTPETLGAEALPRLSGIITQIIDYDHQTQAALTELGEVRTHLSNLSADIKTLSDKEAPPADTQLLSSADHPEATRAEVRAQLQRAHEQQALLESQRGQLLQATWERLQVLLEQARSAGLEIDPQALPLNPLTGETLHQASPIQLRQIETWLSQHLASLPQHKKASKLSELATELQMEWSTAQLAALLEELARQHYQIETLLVLIGANLSHSRDQAISLSRTAVEAILDCIDTIAKHQPFELLGWLVPDLLVGWNTPDPFVQARLMLSMLAARHASGTHLSAELLWQLPADWPFAEMHLWNNFWRKNLMDEPLPSIVSVDSKKLRERLAMAHIKAEQTLARDKGKFVRLNSLRSDRHRQMLGERVLPELMRRLNILIQHEKNIDANFETDTQTALNGLDKAIKEALNALAEDKLHESYSAAVSESRIDDSDSFHRRTALRAVKDCADSVNEYAQALSEYWHGRAQQADVVLMADLETELAAIPELEGLGRRVLEQIQHPSTQTAMPASAWGRAPAAHLLAVELLSQPVYATRLPRLIGHLVSARLDFVEILEPVLEDLANPLNQTEAIHVLLEKEACNQLLLLTQHLPLEIQKQAQVLSVEKDREIAELETELLKAGGQVADIIVARKMGRWRLAKQELSRRLAEQRTAQEREQQRIETEALNLRRAISDLDEAVFKAKATIPNDAYLLVNQGFYLARKALDLPPLFGEAETYLQEIDYRLKHQAWPVNTLQNSVDRLEQIISGKTTSAKSGLTTEKALECFERSDFCTLGLSLEEISESEISTRCDLLRAWLRLTTLPAFFSEGLTAEEQEVIYSVIRFFAQMTALRHVRAPDGKPVAGDQPAIFAHWRLKYPKTDALDNNCVLIALPGQPPSPQYLTQLENLLDEKEWLEYFFVFVFVPGCTPGIHKRLSRLSSKRPHRGLVIIDEAALLSVILAEAEDRTPLGCLRSLMLNARGAENVAVFTVNQMVTAQNAIFVGRDTLVERIASGGDNYALYGGRRIGKSSILAAVDAKLGRRGVKVIAHSFEGEQSCSDDASAVTLAQALGVEMAVKGVGDFKQAVQSHLDAYPDLSIALLLDEIDRYIYENPQRHVLIEAMRTLSDRYHGRFRVMVAGFMSLYACLQGRGPYSPTSDPWRRMLKSMSVGNLDPESAEKIVQEGFLDILGWQFENRTIPQWIVERTGGQPAFVQEFCLKLQDRISQRGDRMLKWDDVQAVFNDRDPEESFIAYVGKTLDMNLDPVGQFLVLLLAKESRNARGFTLDQMRELASLCTTPIPPNCLNLSLEHLSVTSVVKERLPGVYDFSVPDYPLILNQLGQTELLNRLETTGIPEYLRKNYGSSL